MKTTMKTGAKVIFGIFLVWFAIVVTIMMKSFRLMAAFLEWWL